MESEISIPIRRISGSEDIPLPAYESVGAAGMDVRAAVKSTIRLEPGRSALVPSGFAIALPPGYEAQLRPRSGLATKYGVTLVNSPGTIDSDYRGEVVVALINLGVEIFEITRGLRIAQMVVAPVKRAEWNEVQDLPSTSRDSGGFGHTGI
ncbi:MAG: dUTP diphosphatase [Terriglobia bacterium]